jgi:hypothetical protein
MNTFLDVGCSPQSKDRTTQGLIRQLSGSIGPIAASTFVATKLTADRELETPKLLRNLCNALIGFHEGVSLISFDLA